MKYNEGKKIILCLPWQLAFSTKLYYQKAASPNRQIWSSVEHFWENVNLIFSFVTGIRNHLITFRITGCCRLCWSCAQTAVCTMFGFSVTVGKSGCFVLFWTMFWSTSTLSTTTMTIQGKVVTPSKSVKPLPLISKWKDEANPLLPLISSELSDELYSLNLCLG